MPVSIEFQIAGLIYTIILCVAFFRKVKWDSPQNRIYKGLLIVTIAEISLDIVSVISINHRDSHPFLNDVLSKGYLVVMNSFIYTVGLYAISCATNRKLPPILKKLKTALIALHSALLLAIFALIMANTLYYSGYGRSVYSYGIPSDLTYMFSTLSVALVTFVLLLNIRHMRPAQLFSILSFCIMEGIIAIVQMFNKELLLVGFGSAATVFIMYFTVENPDAQTISRLSQANKRAREMLKFYSTTAGSHKSVDATISTPKLFSNVCALVLDMVDFTKFANRMGIERLTKYMSGFFEKVDSASDSFRIEKFKSFGSYYTAISGVQNDGDYSGVSEMVHFAIEILNILKKTNAQSGMNLQLKIGIASGSAVLDLMGNQNLIMNAWGQPLILADALRAKGLPNTITVSESVYAQLNELYDFDETPEVDIEGIGKVRSWQLDVGGGINE